MVVCLKKVVVVVKSCCFGKKSCFMVKNGYSGKKINGCGKMDVLEKCFLW